MKHPNKSKKEKHTTKGKYKYKIVTTKKGLNVVRVIFKKHTKPIIKTVEDEFIKDIYKIVYGKIIIINTVLKF